jgi:HrpA-like RNA helicase
MQEEAKLTDERKELQKWRKALPVASAYYEIITSIQNHQVVIISGETGCGKTTQVPQFLYEAGLHKTGMIGISQPRRVAAVTLAQRISYEVASVFSLISNTMSANSKGRSSVASSVTPSDSKRFGSQA